MSKLLLSLVAGAALMISPLVRAQGATTPPSVNSSQGSSELHESMMSGMKKMQGMRRTGDTDKDFAAMMRMHHLQAVDMAKAEVQHGRSAELKAMAQRMITDQQKEIAELDKWLAMNK